MQALSQRVMPHGLEPSCSAEAGRPSPTLRQAGSDSSISEVAARRVGFGELLGGGKSGVYRKSAIWSGTARQIDALRQAALQSTLRVLGQEP